MHGDGHESLELLVRSLGQQRLRPDVIVAFGVAVEQAANERDECDALEIRAPAVERRVFLIAQQCFEAMRVSQRLRGERGHHLTEANVAVRERLGITVGAEEDRADDVALPLNGHHDDRPHVALVELRANARERRVGGHVGDEDRFAGLVRPLELRIALEIDDEIANRRILVARDQANLVLFAREEDRAAVEAECVTQLAGDGLEDVDEVEGRRDLLQDVDDRDEMVAFALQLGYAGAQPSDFVISIPIECRRRRLVGSCWCCWRVRRLGWVGLIHLPPRGAR